MKLLWINPVTRYLDNARHTPYGILQLMAILDRELPAVEQHLYDANAWRGDKFLEGETEDLDATLRLMDWDVICTGGIITSYNYTKQAVKRCKELVPHAPIIAGGGFMSATPDQMMKFLPQIDYGVVGEAYRTLPELISAFNQEDSLESINGIVYRRQSELKLTPPRDLIPELDWLPFPAYQYAPMDIYFRNSSIAMSEESLVAKKRIDFCGSLGCPFGCHFCYDLGITSKIVQEDGRILTGRPLGRTEMRWHSAKYIANFIHWVREQAWTTVDVFDEKSGDLVGEKKVLLKNLEYELESGEWVGKGYPVDFIAWLDENLQVSIVQSKGKWLEAIQTELEKRNLIPHCRSRGLKHDKDPKCIGPHHGGTGHAGLVSPIYLRRLYDVGFTYLDYGLESWDPQVLQKLRKGSTPKTNARAIQLTLQSGIRPIPNQIIGFEDETWESVKAMLDAWEKHQILTKPFIMTLYPGSQDYITHHQKILDQYGGDIEAFFMDLADAVKPTAIISKNFSAVELLGIREAMVIHSRKFLNEHERKWRLARGLNLNGGIFAT